MMECPKCGTGLVPEQVGPLIAVNLDSCPRCRGTWFDRGELDRLDHSVWSNVETLLNRPVSGAAPLRCPRCGGALTPVSPADAEGLVVERCAACAGFWLDAGELEEVERVATRADEALEARMHRYKKPPAWSALRWLVYCFRTFR